MPSLAFSPSSLQIVRHKTQNTNALIISKINIGKWNQTNRDRGSRKKSQKYLEEDISIFSLERIEIEVIKTTRHTYISITCKETFLFKSWSQQGAFWRTKFSD